MQNADQAADSGGAAKVTAAELMAPIKLCK